MRISEKGERREKPVREEIQRERERVRFVLQVHHTGPFSSRDLSSQGIQRINAVNAYLPESSLIFLSPTPSGSLTRSIHKNSLHQLPFPLSEREREGERERREKGSFPSFFSPWPVFSFSKDFSTFLKSPSFSHTPYPYPI